MDLVKRGEAEAVVSAGHTGALVAASAIKLRTLPGIDRPGLAVIMPTQTHVFLLIDGGATLTLIRAYSRLRRHGQHLLP